MAVNWIKKKAAPYFSPGDVVEFNQSKIRGKVVKVHMGEKVEIITDDGQTLYPWVSLVQKVNCN